LFLGLLTVQAGAVANVLPEGFVGWILNRGQGERVGDSLMVEGDGASENAWLSPAYPFEPVLATPKEVSESLTRFTHDPALIERHRDRLARAIMELQ